jgi:uncharacterized protein involved in copper resistance
MRSGSEHIASTLVRRWVVLSVVLGLLLVPATCVNAAGPHSLFQSPMPAHIGTEHGSSADHDAEMAAHHGMSADEHAGHHHASAETTAKPPAPSESAPTTPAPGGRISDLPSTMAMAAISNPAVTNDLEPVELPGPPSAPTPKTAGRLLGETPALELPPPR